MSRLTTNCKLILFLGSLLIILLPYFWQNYGPLIYRTVSVIPMRPALPRQNELESVAKLEQRYQLAARKILQDEVTQYALYDEKKQSGTLKKDVKNTQKLVAQRKTKSKQQEPEA